MDLQTVRYAVDGAVARIELNRPERHNALNGELLDGLDAASSALLRLRGIEARYLLLTGRIIDGAEAERIGLVSLAVPPDELVATVEGIVADLVAIPADGAMHNKIALNTALSIMGAGALFRYHGEANALGRLAGGDPYR
jgi:enoyl-CoA hydratase/carnithine racemase